MKRFLAITACLFPPGPIPAINHYLNVVSKGWVCTDRAPVYQLAPDGNGYRLSGYKRVHCRSKGGTQYIFSRNARCQLVIAVHPPKRP